MNDVPVYIYYFTKDNGRLGAWHSGEEVYLYGNIPKGSTLYDQNDRALSEQMLRYYCNFISTGNPNGEDLPEWLPSNGTGLVLEFGTQITASEAPYTKLYEILDEMYGFNI